MSNNTTGANTPKPAKVDGARRMGVTFNPSKDPRIDEIKQKYAELHDLVDRYTSEHMTSPNTDDGIARSEIGRAAAKSLTDLQTSKMYAIEAMTR